MWQIYPAAIAFLIPLGIAAGGIRAYQSSPAQTPGPSWISRIASVDLTTCRVLSPPADAHLPVHGGSLFPGEWSPDGGALIYSTDSETPGPRPVFIRSTATGLLRELRTSLVALQRPLWSPDGRAFAVRGAELKPPFGIHLIDARAGEGRQLVAESELLLGWSQDGFRIYFSRFAPEGSLDSEVVEFDIKSGAQRVVFRWRGGESARLGLALARDGKTLYYRDPISAAAPSHRLVARDVMTGRERQLLRSGSIGSLFVSPDGRYVVTSSEDIPVLVPTAGGRPRPLPRVLDQVPTILVWAPNGESFLGRTTDMDDRGLGRASYWCVPLGGFKEVPRKLEWNVGAGAFGFTAGGNWIAFVERVSP